MINFMIPTLILILNPAEMSFYVRYIKRLMLNKRGVTKVVYCRIGLFYDCYLALVDVCSHTT